MTAVLYTGWDDELDVRYFLVDHHDGLAIAVAAEDQADTSPLYDLTSQPLAALVSAPAEGGEALPGADNPESGSPAQAPPAGRGPLSGPAGVVR